MKATLADSAKVNEVVGQQVKSQYLGFSSEIVWFTVAVPNTQSATLLHIIREKGIV